MTGIATCHLDALDHLQQVYTGNSTIVGKVTVNVVPCPSLLCTLMCPPKRVTKSLVIASPKPVPSFSCALAFGAR